MPESRCYYVEGDNGERVLIPGCYGSAAGDECTCPEVAQSYRAVLRIRVMEARERLAKAEQALAQYENRGWGCDVR